MASAFSKKLLSWYDAHRRSLPWVGEKDPYRVWLSEVILQQTRVEQGTAYYQRFITSYPTVAHLAQAPETEVMKMWEGLGYYARARNMHATAKMVTREHAGKFPDTEEALLRLKGIGRYTAHAILSYAFHKPYAVVDGNVLRILSRYAGMTEPIDTPAGRKAAETLANKLIDKQQPHRFNQAMMDLSASRCLPRNPLCTLCPLKATCYAYKHGMTAELPVKTPKKARKKRHFHFAIIRTSTHLLIQQRTGKDIWHNLWQFPLLETGSARKETAPPTANLWRTAGIPPLNFTPAGSEKQLLTHQELDCRFYIAHTKSLKGIDLPNALAIKISDLPKYAFPGAIRAFLKRNNYF